MQTLINGDCLEMMDKLIEQGIKVDAIIADPPYYINYQNLDYDKEKNNIWNVQLLKNISNLLKEDGNLILFQSWSNVCDIQNFIKSNSNFKLKNWIAWDRVKGRGAKKNFTSTREDILWYNKLDNYTFNKVFSNTPKKTKGMGLKNNQENRSLTNVWYDISPIVPWSKEKVNHPNQKPVQLMERLVNIFTNENDTILDFTMGSGTTGVACKNLNRNFIGIELDYKYFTIAKDRINAKKV